MRLDEDFHVNFTYKCVEDTYKINTTNYLVGIRALAVEAVPSQQQSINYWNIQYVPERGRVNGV